LYNLNSSSDSIEAEAKELRTVAAERSFNSLSYKYRFFNPDKVIFSSLTSESNPRQLTMEI
jgi:hypothetical protein